MVLMEISIIPLDKGSSFSPYVARLVDIIDRSGLDYVLTPMGTIIEGEWHDVNALLSRLFESLSAESDRISISAKFDYRKDKSGRLKSKVASIEQQLGRTVRHG